MFTFDNALHVFSDVAAAIVLFTLGTDAAVNAVQIPVALRVLQYAQVEFHRFFNGFHGDALIVAVDAGALRL